MGIYRFAAVGLLLAGAPVFAKQPVKPSVAEQRAALASSFQPNIGRDINDLIREVGPPQGQYQMPNGDVIY
jgi:hypothetical protein